MPAILPEGFTGGKRDFLAERDRWGELERAARERAVLTEKVAGVEKANGMEYLVVRLGAVKGVIMPEDLGPCPRRLAVMVGQPVSFVVKSLDREANVAYLSRSEVIGPAEEESRRALEEEAQALLELEAEFERTRSLLKETGDSSLKARLKELRQRMREVGPVRTAVVRWVDRMGAWLDVGGGLLAYLPAREIDWGRVEDARDKLSPGDAFDVKVVWLDGSLVRASLAAALPDPWDGVKERYRPGGLYGGRVVHRFPDALAVELEPGVEARVPAPPYDDVPPGAEVVVLVTHVRPEGRRIWGALARVQSFPR